MKRITVENEMSNETIGERLRAAREARGLSPFELSLAASIPEQNIRLWERGRCPRDPAKLADIAEALDTTTDYLITGVPAK